MTSTATVGGEDPLAAFRAEVRDFIAAELPEVVREKVRLGIERADAGGVINRLLEGVEAPA